MDPYKHIWEWRKVLFVITPGITGINQHGPGYARMCGVFLINNHHSKQ